MSPGLKRSLLLVPFLLLATFAPAQAGIAVPSWYAAAVLFLLGVAAGSFWWVAVGFGGLVVGIAVAVLWQVRVLHQPYLTYLGLLPDFMLLTLVYAPVAAVGATVGVLARRVAGHRSADSPGDGR